MSEEKSTVETQEPLLSWNEVPFQTFMSWSEEVKLRYLIARDKFALNECAETDTWWQEFYIDRINEYVNDLHEIQAKEKASVQKD